MIQLPQKFSMLLVLGLALCLLPVVQAADIKSDSVEKSWTGHGFTTAQREEIRAAFRWGIDQKFIPGGSLLLIHRGEVVFREGFGVADLDSKLPFSVEAPCRIASITKPHTTTLLAMLVEKGKLSWDDSVDKYLPDFKGIKVRGKGPATRIPNLRELVSHTAGFPGQPAIDAGQWTVKVDGTLAEAVTDLPRQGLATEPGTVYAYTGFGYMVAGRIAEIVTGKEFASLMVHQLLRPIGASTATFFPSPELSAKIPTPYDRAAGEFTKVDIAKRMDASGKFPNPAGRLISPLDDVGQFMLFHRNRGKVNGKQLLSADALKELYKPQPATGPNGYGLGFNIVKKDANGIGTRVRHTGASGTFAQVDFESDLIIVILTQVPQAKTQPARDRLLRAIGSVFSPNETAK